MNDLLGQLGGSRNNWARARRPPGFEGFENPPQGGLKARPNRSGSFLPALAPAIAFPDGARPTDDLSAAAHAAAHGGGGEGLVRLTADDLLAGDDERWDSGDAALPCLVLPLIDARQVR